MEFLRRLNAYNAQVWVRGPNENLISIAFSIERNSRMNSADPGRRDHVLRPNRSELAFSVQNSPPARDVAAALMGSGVRTVRAEIVRCGPFLRASSRDMLRSLRIQSTAKPKSNLPAAMVL